MTVDRMQWYADHNKLAELWRFLEVHGIEPVDGPAYFMEKPYNWNMEYDAMMVLQNGEPLNHTMDSVQGFIKENNLELQG